MAKLSNGIKQGSVLSPILFVIFVDDLLDELNERDERETEPLPGLMFMDDLAVIGCSTDTIERSHKIIMNWCAKWEATINPTKLEILQKNMSQQAKQFTNKHGLDAKETIKKHLKYLGITTNAHAGTPQGWKHHAEARGKKMMTAFYLAGRRGMQWNNASAGTGLRLFDRIFTKIGLYGGEIWDHEPSQTKKLDKQQAKIIKISLLLHPNTPTQWALWETNTLPSAIAIDVAKARAWRACKIKQREGTPTPPNVIKLTQQALDRLGYRKAKWIDTDLTDFPNKEKWNEMVTKWGQEAATTSFEDWWDSKSNDKDRTTGPDLMLIKPRWGDTQEFIKHFKKQMGCQMSMFLKARANSVGLKADATIRGKDGVAHHLKMCRCCNKAEETLGHVLLSCEEHAEERTPIRKAIHSLPSQQRNQCNGSNTKTIGRSSITSLRGRPL